MVMMDIGSFQYPEGKKGTFRLVKGVPATAVA